MSQFSKTIGTIEIECPKCGHNMSYQKILGDNLSEFGVCMKCGEMTYNNPINGIHYKQAPTIKCPYCGSSDTKKIGAVNRLASVATFGLASSTIGKQMQCKKCGNKF